MSGPATGFNPILIGRIEQFYFREARLLDNRLYEQWLELVDPGIVYRMAGRSVPQADKAHRESEAFLSTEAELQWEGVDALPLREERYINLAMKVKRTYRADSWSDNPPPRTRRMVGNVEVEELGGGQFRTRSNVFMFYSARAAANHLYTLGREDILRAHGDSFRIAGRDVTTDEALVTAPTLTQFF